MPNAQNENRVVEGHAKYSSSSEKLSLQDCAGRDHRKLGRVRFIAQNAGWAMVACFGYYPDFLARVRRNGTEWNLIIEVTGEKDAKKDVKVSTARNLWVPAVNNHGTFGRWAFVEITDPWNAKNDIRAFLDNEAGEHR